MTATDELRRMLDELGVEWRGGLPTETIVTDPIDVLYVQRTDGMIHVYIRSYLTPAQAIEATLGPHSNLNTEGSYACPDCGCVVDYGTRGDGEKIVFMEDYVIPLNHCPNCGRRLVKEDA